MGTITVTSAGFAALPATAPAGWPSTLVWPGAIAPNGSKQATITDAEMLQLFTWAATQFPLPVRPPSNTPPPPVAVTVAQILVAWVGTLFQGTVLAIQNYFAVPASKPPPINLN